MSPLETEVSPLETEVSPLETEVSPREYRNITYITYNNNTYNNNTARPVNSIHISSSIPFTAGSRAFLSLELEVLRLKINLPFFFCLQINTHPIDFNGLPALYNLTSGAKK